MCRTRTKLAFREEGITSTQTLVLAVIADYADDDGYCSPSYAAISQRCKFSSKAVMVAVKELVRLGLLAKEQDQSLRFNRYKVMPKMGMGEKEKVTTNKKQVKSKG
jgi:hypothetical protein